MYARVFVFCLHAIFICFLSVSSIFLSVSDFDLLNEQLDKASAIVKAEGVPVVYFQTVLAIENFAKEVCKMRGAIPRA
jgi:hypothetical protein